MKDCDKDCSLVEYIQQSDPHCGNFELQNCQDNMFIVDIVDEHLNIGAPTINVFKLLGVHEQGTLEDVTGNGTTLSSSEHPEYRAQNAFNRLCGSWRSLERGTNVKNAFIGYDFGNIDSDERDVSFYAVDTLNNKHITLIRLQQGTNARNRASAIRLERSMDGVKWMGVQVVNLEDTAAIVDVHFKGSAPARFWRIRPTSFRGGDADFWEVVRVEMHEYEQTALTNIQYDGGFLENRDRDYSATSVGVKMFYDIAERRTDLGPHGMMLTEETSLTVSFKQSLTQIGRPLVIGDVLEIPPEKQYTTDLREVRKYLEVIDVTWSSDGYTPGWQPTLQRITAVPMIAGQETRDIIPLPSIDDTGTLQFNDENATDLNMMSQRVNAEATTNVPQRGKTGHVIYTFSDEEIAAARAEGANLEGLNHNQVATYIEDAMPPNNEPYTEGVQWPESPTNGDWHRLVYEGDHNIPAKLFKYNSAKMRWIYYETDRRQQYQDLKPSIQEALRVASKTKSYKS